MEDPMNIDTHTITESPAIQSLQEVLARLRLMARNRDSLFSHAQNQSKSQSQSQSSSTDTNDRKKHRKISSSSPSSPSPQAQPVPRKIPTHQLREIPPVLVSMSDTLGDMISEELRDRSYARNPALVAEIVAKTPTEPAPVIPSAVHDHVDVEDDLRTKFGVSREIEILQVPMCTDVLDDIVSMCIEKDGKRPETGYYMQRGQQLTSLEAEIMLGKPTKYVLELLDAAMFMNIAFIVEFAKVTIFWKLMAAQGRDISGMNAETIDQMLGSHGIQGSQANQSYAPTNSRTVPTKPRQRFRAK